MTKPSLSRILAMVIASLLLYLGPVSPRLAAQDVAADKPFLHPLFSDHMVLQRNMETAVWGWTRPGEEVKVTLADKTATGVADAQGKWMVKLKSLPAGGPHTMTVVGSRIVEIKDVLVGDVWICAGQSNMQMSVSGSMNAREEIAAATHPRIRFFSVPWGGLRPGQPAVMHTEPQQTVAAKWEACSPQTVSDFSAVGYFFARDLQKEVDVPIGLIRAAVGGSSIVSWCALPVLEAVPELKGELQSLAMLKALVKENKIGQAYFDGVVRQWWLDHDAGTREAWFKTDCDTSAWKKLTLAANGKLADPPDPPRFDGIVWFRKEVDIPQNWAGHDLSLHLTGLWEADTTWFNGTVVGTFDQGWINRTSKVSGTLVKAGRNVIAVRVIVAQGSKGYQGPSGASKIELAGSKPPVMIALGGERSLQQSTPRAKLPPYPHRLDNDFQVPTVLYNGMLAPLSPFAIKGALWYQGETACPGGQAMHRRLLPAMITDWRSQFASPDSWFLIVQLPVLGGTPTLNPEGTGAAEIRAVQWDVGHSVVNADTAVITDLGDANDIHPKNKQDVGKRLALIAQARIYGKSVEYSGPIFKSAAIEGDAVRIKYDHVGGGLVIKDGTLEGFAIAGVDRKWVWAEARIDGDEVLVSSPLVKEPKFLRYDYVDVPRYRLWNKAGLPAAPFNATIKP
ncbi:MAG: sialate O-acetylesterase [Tepidisphaeraceae bacterium]